MLKVYNGLLVATNNGEEDDLLGLMIKDGSDWHTEILADMIKDDIYNGNYLSVLYFISDKKLSKDELIEQHLKILYGIGDIEYRVRYSETTGYLWTDEEINVGGHDLLEELKSYFGEWLYMEIEYSKELKQ
jgi:hypothetical protein